TSEWHSRPRNMFRFRLDDFRTRPLQHPTAIERSIAVGSMLPALRTLFPGSGRKERSMKRRLSALALAAATAVACSGGGGGSAPGNAGSTRGAKGKRPVVGVSVLTETHDFYKELEAGMRDEAKARGLDLVITSCEMDPAKQASQIEDFVAQHVTALLIAPCDSAAVGANLSGAEQAGIPVFTVD